MLSYYGVLRLGEIGGEEGNLTGGRQTGFEACLLFEKKGLQAGLLEP